MPCYVIILSKLCTHMPTGTRHMHNLIFNSNKHKNVAFKIIKLHSNDIWQNGAADILLWNKREMATNEVEYSLSSIMSTVGHTVVHNATGEQTANRWQSPKFAVRLQDCMFMTISKTSSMCSSISAQFMWELNEIKVLRPLKVIKMLIYQHNSTNPKDDSKCMSNKQIYLRTKNSF